MKCNSKVTTVQEAKYPFTYHSDGFYRIGLVGEHKNVHTLALEIATYLEYDTLIIASNTIRKLPDNYFISGVSRNVIFSNNSNMDEMQKVIDASSAAHENVVTICDTLQKNKNAAKLTGNLIYIYGTDVESMNVNNIVMPKNCPHDVKKRVHVYCDELEIKLLKFDTFCSQLSNIGNTHTMVVNNKGVYDCANFTEKLLRCSEIDRLQFEINPIMEVFDRIKNPHKSIVICGPRGSGKTLFIETYIKYAGHGYEKCMFIDLSNRFSDFILSTGCSCLATPDTDEVINFSRSDGKKLLVLSDLFKGALSALYYSDLVCCRHLLNLTIISIHQCPEHIVQLNHDHYVTLRTGQIKNVHSMYGSYYPSFDVFRRDHDIITSHYGAIVTNNISTNDYRKKTFAVRADVISVSDSIGIKFTPHKLINKELSATWIDTCKHQSFNTSSGSGLDDEWHNMIGRVDSFHGSASTSIYPHTLITGRLDKSFTVFKSYANHIGNYYKITKCHIFVSAETESDAIKELDNANCCVHYGYDTDELSAIIKHQSVSSGKNMMQPLHVCIIVPHTRAHFRDFVSCPAFEELLLNARHNKICATVVYPIENNIFRPLIRNQFNIVISNYTCDNNVLKMLYSSYFESYPNLNTFIEAMNGTYSSDDNKITVLVESHRVNYMKTATINKQFLNKHKDTLKCDRKYKSNLDMFDCIHEIKNNRNTKSSCMIDCDSGSDTDSDSSVGI